MNRCREYRMTLRRLMMLFAALFALSACSPFTFLNAAIGEDGFTVHSGIRFGPEARHVLDAYVPRQRDGPLPIVVFFYGGSWRAGERADYLFAAEALAGRGYVAIVPDYLPLHRELVYLSGICEILFGLGLLWHKTREAAGTCLIVLYLAVLPANINMAVQDIQPASFHIPVFLLWARLPFQLVFIYWAWRVSRPESIGDETFG